MPLISSGTNASLPSYNATVQSTNRTPTRIEASNNWRPSADQCCTASFLIYSAGSMLTILGLSIAQAIVKLQTGEKSETLEKASRYTGSAYLVVAVAFLIYACATSPSSSGSGSYGRGSSSTADGYYYFDGGDSSHGHHDSGGDC